MVTGTGYTFNFIAPEPHAGDIQLVRDVAAGYQPAAVLTPDGKWHEQARIGHWGMTFPEDEHGLEAKTKDAWAVECERLFAKLGDHVAVLVDCHV